MKRISNMAAVQHPGDQHGIPDYEAHASAILLKDRIKQHYEIASDYYYSLWYVRMRSIRVLEVRFNYLMISIAKRASVV